ncbi:SDR family NAD(P)-dependent oxidoreductase [Gaetbulibacter aestuarii]|uniref:SDR family NAD(P)-dependent oxidoreductase n=1 Tax=Gaetbulibacter aestuarii TaxID=1502358 RepID=A0ABW7N2I3_9FLAO
MRTFTLITGASQGFGKAMALECAQRKMNLLLIALPQSGLGPLAAFIEKNLNVEVHFLECDLSTTESCYNIAKYVSQQKLNIRYLINNAGVLSRGMFDTLDPKFILRQIAVNVTTPTLLIRLLLENLKRSGPSAILNISSMASFFSLPKKQVYGATKSYVTAFSKTLKKELKQHHISVTTICPGGLNTTTRLCYQNRLVGWITRQSVLNPEDAARIAIDAMLKNKTILVPGFVNQCLMFLNKLLPDFIKDYLANRELNKFPPGKLQPGI